MRSLVFIVLVGAFALLSLAGFIIDPGARTQATAAGAQPARPAPYNADAVWFRPDTAVTPCDGEPRACLRASLAESGASQAALDFFDGTGAVLEGFAPGAPVSVGRAEPAAGSEAGPTLVFLNGSTRFQWLNDILRATYDATPKHGDTALTGDPMYEALVAALAGNSPQPTVSQTQRLESITVLPTGDEESVVQVGVTAGCSDCGLGVAERYAFDFGSDGRLLGVRLLGLCEGGPVAGVGPVAGHTYVVQEYGGTQFFHLPELAPCPPHSPV